MHRARLLYGALDPNALSPFLLTPNTPEGAEGGGTPPASPAPPVTTPPTTADGDAFPTNTPVEQMTAPQQAAYWKHYARKHEGTAKQLVEWQNANKAKVEGYDALLEASKSEQERAIEEAKATATAAGRAEMIPHLLQAEFVAAAAGKLTRDQALELVAPLNAAHFLDDNGNVDTAKVTSYVGKYISAAAPAPNGAKLPAGFPDLGQGKKAAATVTGKDAGLAEAARRGYIQPPQQQTA
jgi:hypothetical protein